jgi:hypothetical protein
MFSRTRSAEAARSALAYLRRGAAPGPPWLPIRVRRGGWWHRVAIAAGARDSTEHQTPGDPR